VPRCDTQRIVAVAVLVLIMPLAVVVARLTARHSTGIRRAVPHTHVAARALEVFPWRRGGGSLLVILAAPPLVSTALVFHATSILGQRDLPVAAAATALAALALAGAAGALIGGVLVDRFGPRLTLAGKSLLLVAAAALILAPPAAAPFAAFAVVGFAGGLNSTVSGAVWARTYGTRRLGALQSTGEAARIAAAAIGPLPLAVSLSMTGSYGSGLVILAVFSAICAILGFRWTAEGTSATP
jgi:Na+/melibiose symporter-like transporter